MLASFKQAFLSVAHLSESAPFTSANVGSIPVWNDHRNNRHRMRDDDESCLHFFTVRALLNAPY